MMQTDAVSLTRENIQKLQTEFEENERRKNSKMAEVISRGKEKSARSEGDGQSVETTHNENRRMSLSSFGEVDTAEKTLSGEIEEEATKDGKRATRLYEEEENEEEESLLNGEEQEENRGEIREEERIENEEKRAGENGLDMKEVEEENIESTGNSREDVSPNLELRRASIKDGAELKKDIKLSEREAEESLTEKHTLASDVDDERSSAKNAGEKKEEKDEDEEQSEESEDDEDDEKEEENDSTDFIPMEENQPTELKPNNTNYLIYYESADEKHYETDDLYKSDESDYAEYERQLREEMENAESPTESESEITPVVAQKDEDRGSISSSRSSSLFDNDDEDDDDDDDDDDTSEDDVEEDQEKDISVRDSFYTSTDESVSSIQTYYSNGERENEDSLSSRAATSPSNKLQEDSEEEDTDEGEICSDLSDDGGIRHEGRDVQEQEQRSRPETRLISGRSVSPVSELQTGSDRFDEYEGRVFDMMEFHFSTPGLSERKSIIKVEGKKGKDSKTFDKVRRSRKRKRKEIEKLRYNLYRGSDTEDDKPIKKEKTKRRRRNYRDKSKKQAASKSDNSEHTSGPIETAFSCSSEDKWKKLSSSEERRASIWSTSSGQRYITDTESCRSSRDSRQTSYCSKQSDYVSSYLPSPPPIIEGRKICWPISGRLRELPPIRAEPKTRKVCFENKEKSATNKPSKKKVKKSQSASTRQVKTDDTSSMVQRILSANRNKITKLYNTVEELQQEVDNLRQENRTLKREHVKQEREIKRIEKAEASLPQLLQRHSAELRTYRERLKKNKLDISKKEKESHSNDVEITKLRDKIKYYKSLDGDKKLEERAALAKRLEKVEKDLSERDRKIMELQKTITLTEKARQREIKEQQDRFRKAKEELKRTQENVFSLREKLKEKEKQLDVANIYHLNIQRRLKKSNPLALPPVPKEDLHSREEIESTVSHTDKKRNNVFITNGPSDASSNFTTESGTIERQLSDAQKSKKSVESEQREKTAAVARSLELEELEAMRMREKLEMEARKRKDEEDARKREEDARKKEEEERKREQEMEWERIKKIEEERKRQEEEKRKQEEMRKRREEEQIRKEKEEQEKLKFKEDEEIRRKKDLLLARMRAIDKQNDVKPNGIIDVELGSKPREEKPKKLPIFLQSTEKPKEAPIVHGATHDNDKSKTGSNSSLRSKHSQSSSYDFKETIENLHHGLPAHPSDQHFRSVGSKGRRDSIGDDELMFGSYKPSVGKHAVGNKKPDTVGSYNPSFGDPKKDTALDFSKKPERTVSTPPKENGLVFGSYQPTFGGSVTNKTNSPVKDSEDVFDGTTRRGGRRVRGNLTQNSNSIFGDDLFNNNNSVKQNKSTSLFNEDSLTKSSPKSYPWENKANVSKQSVDESLLPRRQKIQQSLNKGHEQNVPAVRNVLNDTIDDDIEEVTL